MELITFCSNSFRVVNERPLTAVSSDPRDNTLLTPAFLFTPGLDPYVPVGRAHDKDEFRRNYDVIWLWQTIFGMIGWIFNCLLYRVKISGRKLLETSK